jgi:hypothetical protein
MGYHHSTFRRRRLHKFRLAIVLFSRVVAMLPVLAQMPFATPALAQETDGVTAMCVDATAPDALALCTCATEALREQLTPDNFALRLFKAVRVRHS